MEAIVISGKRVRLSTAGLYYKFIEGKGAGAYAALVSLG